MVFFNRCFDKGRLKSLIAWSLMNSGEKNTLQLVENLKNLGFEYATRAGISLSLDDLKIPPTKAGLVSQAELEIQSTQQEFQKGNLTAVEKFQQMIDTWHRTSENLRQNVVNYFKSTDLLNPVYMMAFSGARGNISQVRQLVGMRGLMADPQGQIIDFPIRSNFREGLTLTEYIISCYGARKGLVDTALRTANSGYLTRRLVDVAQHIIVSQLDCGTQRGIFLTDMRENNQIILPLQNRLIGRVLAEDVSLSNGKLIPKNSDISHFLANKIAHVKNNVLVRSPLVCEAKNSICQLCYGWSLAHCNIVSLGEAVGILAAQSIGEPGTQLTMRTFHTGGVFTGDLMNEIRASSDATICFPEPLQGTLIRTPHGKIAFLTKIDGKIIVKSFFAKEYNIPASTVLFVRQGEKVFKNQILAEFTRLSTQINQRLQSKHNLNSDLEGEIYFENVFLGLKTAKEGDIIRSARNLGSLWILSGKIYQSIIPSTLFSKKGDLVSKKSLMNQSLVIIPNHGILKTKNLNKHYFKNNDKFLLLNKSFLNLPIKNINFQKLGYFFSLFSNDQFFIYNSLHKSNKSINKFQIENQGFLKSLSQIYWFPKNFRTQTGGFYHIDNYYFNNPINCGQIFWIDEENHIMEYDNLFFKGSLKKWCQKTTPISYKLTSQGKRISFYSNFNSLVEINSEKKNITNELKSLELFCLKQNLSIIKRRRSLKFYQNPFCKNFLKLTHIGFDSFYKKTKHVKIKNLAQIQLKSGWVYFPQNLQKNLKSNKFFLGPGKLIFDDLIFDQSSVFIEYFLIDKFFNLHRLNQKYQSSKIIFLKNEQLLKNWALRVNIISNNFLSKSSTNLVNKKDSKKNVNSRKFSFILNKNIKSRWQIQSIKKSHRFFVVIRKVSEFNIFNSSIFKKKLYNLNPKNLPLFSAKLPWFNKQIISRLFYPMPGIDLKIKFFSCFNNNQFQKYYIFKKMNIFEIFISFVIPTIYPLKTFDTKLKLIGFFNRYFEFSVSRQMQLAHFMVSELQNKKGTTSHFLAYQNFKVYPKKPTIVTSFLSPYEGEIIAKKMNFLGQQSCLILTNLDLVNFSINSYLNGKVENRRSLKYVGDLIRFGDKIEQKLATTESGQVIQIDKNNVLVRRAHPILFSSRGVFHVQHRDFVEIDTPLITLFYQRLKTGDIVQGIPKIEEFFEARQTKEGEILPENLHDRLNELFQNFKQKFNSQEAVRKSVEKIQQILVEGIQGVYQSQGVTIADKHLEIIVRQMTSKVKITEGGQTGLLRGELIDLEWIELVNKGIETQIGNLVTSTPIKNVDFIQKAEYEPVILGITKASLETESFISAASFQETTRILSRAAIERKTDFLRGLKENVILGHLIPAGTGFSLSFDPENLVGSRKNVYLE